MGEIIAKVRGRSRQSIGDLTGKERLRREGREGRTQAQVEGAVKDAKRGVSERIQNCHRCSTK
jgi:uncharacterized protein YjbJ (UPF0337 family)